MSRCRVLFETFSMIQSVCGQQLFNVSWPQAISFVAQRWLLEIVWIVCLPFRLFDGSNESISNCLYEDGRPSSSSSFLYRTEDFMMGSFEAYTDIRMIMQFLSSNFQFIFIIAHTLGNSLYLVLHFFPFIVKDCYSSCKFRSKKFEKWFCLEIFYLVETIEPKRVD